jgi:hypothetical protein
MGSINKIIPRDPNRAVLKVIFAFLNSFLCNSNVMGLDTDVLNDTTIKFT